MRAEGPAGDVLGFNLVLNVMDPNNRANALILTHNPPPTGVAVLPYSEDVVSLFYSAQNPLRNRAGLPAVTYQVASATKLPQQRGIRLSVTGTEDFHDDKGPRAFVRDLTLLPQRPNGLNVILFAVQSVPRSLGSHDTELLAEMAQSYRVDQQVMQQVGAANSAAIAHSAATQAEGNTIVREGAQRNADRNALDYTTANQDMQHGGMGQANTLAGQTSVLDMQTGQHKLMSIAEASALIGANPNRFRELSPYEYLPNERY